MCTCTAFKWLMHVTWLCLMTSDLHLDPFFRQLLLSIASHFNNYCDFSLQQKLFLPLQSWHYHLKEAFFPYNNAYICFRFYLCETIPNYFSFLLSILKSTGTFFVITSFSPLTCKLFSQYFFYYGFLLQTFSFFFAASHFSDI